MNKPTLQPNYDARWKELILALHRYFIKRFFPKLYEQIDFSKGVRSLDKELQKLLADWVKKGYRTADLLLEYHLKTGEKQLVLIHVEIQHIFDLLLPKRMHVSFYRILDRFPDTRITAIALYTGEDVPANFDRYVYEFEGVKLEYKFNTFQVREQKEEVLLASDNPFDLALLAGLYALKAKDDVQQALIFKKKLARLCFERGYDKETIWWLINFVTFLIALPEAENLQYEETVIDYIKDEVMPVPVIEERPDVARILSTFLFGKTYVERDKERDKARDKERDKEKMLYMHFVGNLEPAFIAKMYKVEIEYVKTIIEEAKKQGWQPPDTSNGETPVN